MSRPLLLDLFCCAGGAGMGYYRAGFDVIGVDVQRQPRYPFRFVQADALRPPFDLSAFDAIHASPPCQQYSMASQSQRNAGKEYPDLVDATREMLETSGLPWVIENVPGAPIRPDIVMCGCQVGLELRRVRWFETSWRAFSLTHPCDHRGPVVSVVGHGTPTYVRKIWKAKYGRDPNIHDYRAAMGIDWMNRSELSQAIPPAYTHHVGEQMLRTIAERVA